jgi:hypothetical protein
VEHPTSEGREDGLIGLQIIPIQSRDQLLLIPTRSLVPNDLVFPLWGLKNSALAVLMAKIFSLGDSLKSRLKNGVTGSLNIN